MKKFNHMFDFAFTVDSEFEDPYEIPRDQLFTAIQKRLDDLKQHPEEAADVFGYCNDSYEVTS
jgi:hypothetical protein